jgi:two-component system, cell cycle sensor histidine kinase and response regulator CckA
MMDAYLLLFIPPAALALYFFYRAYAQKKNKVLFFREILDSSRGARLVVNEKNETLFMNSKFHTLCKPYGSPSYQCLLTMVGDKKQNLENISSDARAGQVSSFEVGATQMGQMQWLVINAQPVSGFKNHVHFWIEDVTSKHEQSQQILEERSTLIDYSDNAPVGFFSVNETGKFVFINATFCRWVGYSSEELLSNLTLHDLLVTPPDRASPYDIKSGGGVRQISEIYIKSKNGREFLAAITQTVVHEDDGKVRTRAVMNDLTAEKTIRQALEDSESRFERFFEEAPLGIALIDKDGIVKDCNVALAKLLSRGLSSIEGKAYSEMIDMADWKMVTSVISRISKGEVINDPLEVKLWVDDTQTSLPCQLFARQFGEGSHIALHFIDLTKQKNLETQFIQSQKMQAVGQLAGGIAHDFNNLLTAIIGFSDLLLLRHKPGDPSFSDIQQIRQNSNRAANLVRQLLAFSRQQTLRPQVQDITDILTEVSHLLRRLIGVNIELKLVHGNDLGMVKVDGGQMEQVLVNMAVNARDAMSESGSLIITTRSIHNTYPMTFGEDTMPIGDWVVIDIKDTGTGIPPDVLERIFEPFFTTKDVGKGTGLGLATVYGIIRQTGGYLGVDSTVGQGTTFSIYLPRVDAEEAKNNIPVAPTEETEIDLTGTARILLVEDEDAVRTFSTRALTNKGYDVITAEHGEAGLTVFKEQTKPIDLLITDVMMPGMDGPTLAKEIRATNPTLKIIFVSGYTEEKLKDTLGAGIYFLAKPFTLKQLAAKVKEVLEE